jgi:hypothetical protein
MYLLIIFLTPAILWAQQPLNKLDSIELKKARDEAMEQRRIATEYYKKEDPKLYLYYHYIHDKSKKELEETQKRYKEQSLLSGETLKDVAEKIVQLEELVKKKKLR